MQKNRCFFLLSFILLLTISVVKAQNKETEPKATELKEVKVQGQREYAIDDGIVYIPTLRDRRSSRNAIDMLTRLGITQLDVDPQTFAVKTLNNQDVQFFVNGVKDDPNKIWTMEVKRVEFLISPKDPRFMGAQYVVNYIVQEYEYGGYTRFSDKVNFYDFYSNNAGIFSRMKYKDMTYDINVGYNTSNDMKKGGFSSVENFYLLDSDGSPRLTGRSQSMKTINGSADKIPVSLRGYYQHGMLSVSSNLSFTYVKSHNDMEGMVALKDPENPSIADSDNRTFTNNSGRTRAWNWYTDAFYMLPKGWSLGFNGTLEWDFNNADYTYKTGLDTPIDNISKERRFNIFLVLMANKTIKDHRLSITARYNEGSYKIDYAGSLPSFDNINNPKGSIGFSYGYTRNKINIQADASIGNQWNKVNATTHKDISFASHLSASYTPNKKNQFSLWVQYAIFPSIRGSMYSQSIIKVNEFTYITGNPGMKPQDFFNLDLSYSWIPDRSFSMTAYSNFEMIGKRVTQGYEHYDNGNYLLRREMNSGDIKNEKIGVSARARLFSNKLVLNLTPEYYYQSASGINSATINDFRFKINATYYIKSFWISGFFRTPDRTYDTLAGTVVKRRPHYEITFGWGNGNWVLWGGLLDVFSDSWKTSSISYTSDVFKSNRDILGVSCHRQFVVSASYTFGYGKKVKKNNESTAQSSSESSILGL